MRSRGELAGALLALVVLACSDERSTAPVSASQLIADVPRLVQAGIDQGRMLTRPIEADFESIARVHPGFAGMYFDSTGALVMRAVGSASVADLRVAAQTMFARIGRPFTTRKGAPLGVKVVPAVHTFTELAVWRDMVSEIAFAGDSEASLDLDEVANAVVIGVSTPDNIPAIEGAVAAAGVPKSAVVVRQEPRAFQTQTLEDRYRPLAGGTRMTMPNVGSCSLGVPVRWNGNQVWLTASHCTRWRNFPDGGQGFFIQPVEAIGREIWDRSGWSCGAFNMKLPPFSGHLQRLDFDSRQEVFCEETRTESV